MDSTKRIHDKFVELCNRLDNMDDLGDISDVIFELEKCRDDGIKLGVNNSDIIALLICLYIFEERVFEACQLIAEMNVPLLTIEKNFIEYMPRYVIQKYNNLEVSLSEYVLIKMKESEISYDDYYKIFKAYPSGRYAQILINYAREEDRRFDTLILSDSIREVLQVEKKSKIAETFYQGKYNANIQCIMLAYYTERLEDVSFLGDYSEIRKCVLDAKRVYDYEKKAVLALSEEWIPRFWINFLHCLNIIERYDRTIEMSKETPVVIDDGLYYFYIAEAYYAFENIEKAKLYCKRAVALSPDTDNMLLLAHLLFTDGEYEDAEKIILEIITLQNTKKKSIYVYSNNEKYTEHIVSRNINDIDFRKKLESPYSLLFMCYIFKGELARASAFYEEMKEKIGVTDLVVISGYVLQIEKYSQKHLMEIETEKIELKAKLQKTKCELEQLQKIIRMITNELLGVQSIDEDIEITSEYWEDSIQDKMMNAIENIMWEVNKTNPKSYELHMNRIEKIYPNMCSSAKEFLTSAEQMYDVFKGNVVIDFAPIMVEYCKTFEVLIWNYLDESGEYSQEIEENTRKNKCLGTAEFCIKLAIKKGKNKSLNKYIKDINKITTLRNNSAHKQVTKESPDIKWIIKKIWCDNGLIRDLLKL